MLDAEKLVQNSWSFYVKDFFLWSKRRYKKLLSFKKFPVNTFTKNPSNFSFHLTNYYLKNKTKKKRKKDTTETFYYTVLTQSKMMQSWTLEGIKTVQDYRAGYSGESWRWWVSAQTPWDFIPAKGV